jgi:ATP-dependent Clp protease, protease subunit
MLSTRRTVLLNGVIDDLAAESAAMRLRMLESLDPEAPAHLYLSSPGGDLAAGLGLAAAVADAGCPVWTLCMGQARGVALLVAASGAPGHRYALPNTHLSFALREPGPPELRGLVAAGLAERSGRPLADVEADLAVGRTLAPADAIAAGLLDRVVRGAAEL